MKLYRFEARNLYFDIEAKTEREAVHKANEVVAADDGTNGFDVQLPEPAQGARIYNEEPSKLTASNIVNITEQEVDQ